MWESTDKSDYLLVPNEHIYSDQYKNRQDWEQFGFDAMPRSKESHKNEERVENKTPEYTDDSDASDVDPVIWSTNIQETQLGYDYFGIPAVNLVEQKEHSNCFSPHIDQEISEHINNPPTGKKQVGVQHNNCGPEKVSLNAEVKALRRCSEINDDVFPEKAKKITRRK